ncbi:MAG: hypothetical protein HY673_00875 [Chloroflexi bacterium]|nr:hypothetical protein [Chloroflexota bacterium]
MPVQTCRARAGAAPPRANGSTVFRKLVCIAAAMTLAAGVYLPTPLRAAKAGTPSDSYTIGRYYADDDSNDPSTTTSVLFQDKTTLTFTPRGSGSKYYLVIAGALIANSSASYVTGAQLLQTTPTPTTLAITHYQPNMANYYVPFAAQKIVTLSGGTSYTFKIQYYTSNGSGTAAIQKARIAAIEVANYANAIDESNTTNQSTSYAAKVTLNFTSSSANYLIIAAGDTANSAANYYTKARVIDTASADQGEGVQESPAALQYRPYAMMQRASLSAGSQTYTLQYASQSAVGGREANMQNARVSAVLLSDLGADSYAVTEGPTATQSITYVDMTTLTFTPAVAGVYLVIGSAFVTNENTAYEGWANLDINGTSYAEAAIKPRSTSAYMPFFAAVRVSLAASSQTIKLQWRTNFAGHSAREAFIKNARIIALRLNTLESYSDSGYGAVSNNFTVAGSPVYIRGNGQAASGAYRIAYYDAGASGGQWLKTTDTSADAAGEITDSTFIPSNFVGSAAGDWRAVLTSQSYSPPLNYNDFSAAQKIAEDTFAVNASAIPELPTSLAVIASLALSFAAYYLMRKRRGLAARRVRVG